MRRGCGAGKGRCCQGASGNAQPGDKSEGYAGGVEAAVRSFSLALALDLAPQTHFVKRTEDNRSRICVEVHNEDVGEDDNRKACSAASSNSVAQKVYVFQYGVSVQQKGYYLQNTPNPSRRRRGKRPPRRS